MKITAFPIQQMINKNNFSNWIVHSQTYTHTYDGLPQGGGQPYTNIRHGLQTVSYQALILSLFPSQTSLITCEVNQIKKKKKSRKHKEAHHGNMVLLTVCLHSRELDLVSFSILEVSVSMAIVTLTVKQSFSRPHSFRHTSMGQSRSIGVK